MKIFVPNKHLNVSNNYLNHIEKTVTTFICRNKECFEFLVFFMFEYLVLIEIQNYMELYQNFQMHDIRINVSG